jgi:hypothetical protein
MIEYESLEAELIRAGRSLVIEPAPDDLEIRVLAAIGTVPARARRRAPSWWRWLRARRRRLVAAVIAAVILALTLTPPVRAAVIEWLRIGGVVIKTGAPPVGTPTVSPPTVVATSALPTRALPTSGGSLTPAPPTGGPLGLEQARAYVDFPIGVPSLLGEPERVTVSTDRRVVGMDWTVSGRRVHLDQFDGTLSWVFLKRSWKTVTPTQVNGQEAAWLADPHEISYVDRDGVERRETARVSGPCLVWETTLGDRVVTARLEGIGELPTARAVAETLR